MTSTLGHHPHHHNHFAHHVRTKAWGIEPGWKFVNTNQHASIFPDLLDKTSPFRRSFRSNADTSSISSSSLPKTNYYGGSGSNLSRLSNSIARGGSLREPKTRSIEIKMLDQPFNSLASSNKFGGSQALRSYSSTLPRVRGANIPNDEQPQQKQHAKVYGTTSVPLSGTQYVPRQPLVPPGVLKKPGSIRAPKHFKRVAFLDNAEHSRGIP